MRKLSVMGVGVVLIHIDRSLLCRVERKLLIRGGCFGRAKTMPKGKKCRALDKTKSKELSK